MLEHDEGIHIPLSGMPERPGKRADDGEPELPPKPHRPLVGGNDEVELHRAKAQGGGDFLRMAAHGRSRPQAAGRRAHDVAAIADMAALAGLIGLEVVGADHPSAGIGTDEGLCRKLHPGMPRLLRRDVLRVAVGFARAENGFENGPDVRPVVYSGFSDGNAHGFLGGLTK